MERRTIPEAENRLVILYAIRQLGPCTAAQLLQFMVEYDLMNYFTMQLALCEMEEQGQLTQQAHPIGGLLTITREGAYTIRTFDHRIPISCRELIDREAPAWHDRFRLEQQMPAEITDDPDGKRLHLQLLENGEALMAVTLCVSKDDEAAVFLQRRWLDTAQEVHQLVHHVLSLGFTEDGPMPPLPKDTELQHTQSGDYLLPLRCQNGGALCLSLPDERLARWYAAQWAQCGEGLLLSILELLHLSNP